MTLRNERKDFCVIMSIYKNDSLLNFKKAYESIRTQTISGFDIYVQADGILQDDVRGFLETITDEHLLFFERRNNKGLAYSLNELLKRVLEKPYTYIARMDADDISLPKRFERQLEFLDEHPDTDCVGTWAIEIDESGREYFRKSMPISHPECLNFFRKRDCLIHPTVMFRRSYFEKAGLYPEDTYFGEDTMMWAHGFNAGCHFANLPEYLFQFRLDSRFFERRRGWKHAKSIYQLRRKVNKMLDFGWRENIYAGLYALAKLMPKGILNVLYKTLR